MVSQREGGAAQGPLPDGIPPAAARSSSRDRDEIAGGACSHGWQPSAIRTAFGVRPRVILAAVCAATLLPHPVARAQPASTWDGDWSGEAVLADYETEGSPCYVTVTLDVGLQISDGASNVGLTRFEEQSRAATCSHYSGYAVDQYYFGLMGGYQDGRIAARDDGGTLTLTFPGYNTPLVLTRSGDRAEGSVYFTPDVHVRVTLHRFSIPPDPPTESPSSSIRPSPTPQPSVTPPDPPSESPSSSIRPSPTPALSPSPARSIATGEIEGGGRWRADGHVLVLTANNKFVRLAAGVRLRPGDVIHTRPGSRAVILYPDSGDHAQIGPNSQWRVGDPNAGTIGELMQGAFRWMHDRYKGFTARRFQVRDPNSGHAAAPRGTDFVMTVAEDRPETKYYVREGEIAIQRPGRVDVPVPAGTSAQVVGRAGDSSIVTTPMSDAQWKVALVAHGVEVDEPRSFARDVRDATLTMLTFAALLGLPYMALRHRRRRRTAGPGPIPYGQVGPLASARQSAPTVPPPPLPPPLLKDPPWPEAEMGVASDGDMP